MDKRDSREMAMKVLQWLATVAFVMAGIALLCAPADGQGSSAAKAAFLRASADGGTEVPPLQSDEAVPLQSQGSSPAKAFVPTRFTVTDAGTVGKPDVLLEGWLK